MPREPMPRARSPPAPARRPDLDSVEDLAVPGATAQMRSEVTGRIVPGEVRALLVDECLDPDEDARRAEAALKRPGGCERGGKTLPLRRVEPFQGRDRLAGRFFERDLAAHRRLAIDQHRAAAALAGRGTAVLGRGDVELLAERRQQMRVSADLDLFPVEPELGHGLRLHHLRDDPRSGARAGFGFLRLPEPGRRISPV